MNILIVSDFGLHHRSGGAQITLSHLLDAAINNDHFVTVLHHDTPPSRVLDDKYDVVVSMNLELLSQRPEILSYIVEHQNHVRYEQDSCAYLRPAVRQELFESAKHVVFLSQYHIDFMSDKYGKYISQLDYRIVYPQISRDFNKNHIGEREDAIFYSAFFHPLKGIHVLFERMLLNNDQKFVVSGFGDQRFVDIIKSFRNCMFVGEIKYRDMPTWYKRYTNFLYHTEQPEPFCRTVLEALACGCGVDCNEDMIGVMKEIRSRGLENVLNDAYNSANLFWNEIS